MIVAIDIDSSLVRIGYSHVGDHLDEIVEIASPVSQRALMPLIIESLHSLIGSSPVDAMGIACGGKVNTGKGTIEELTGTNWSHLRVAKPLRDAFDSKIVLMPTALAGASAEIHQFSKKNIVTLYLHLSRNVAGCLIEHIQPPIFRYLPEIGKLVIVQGDGKARSWDTAWASIDHTTFDRKQIVEILTPGILASIALSRPDKIILGGEASSYYKSFGKLLQEELKKSDIAQLPIISSAKLGANAPLIGAMEIAAQTMA